MYTQVILKSRRDSMSSRPPKKKLLITPYSEKEINATNLLKGVFYLWHRLKEQLSTPFLS